MLSLDQHDMLKRKDFFECKLLNVSYAQIYRPSHTVHGRSTLKDGIDNEHVFQNRLFRELKIANKSKDLVKVLLKSNQKSTVLSVNRWCRQTVIADDRKWFANFYGTYKDNMFHDHTLGNNKDAISLLDCISVSCQSEEAHYRHVWPLLWLLYPSIVFVLKRKASSAAIF